MQYNSCFHEICKYNDIIFCSSESERKREEGGWAISSWVIYIFWFLNHLYIYYCLQFALTMSLCTTHTYYGLQIQRMYTHTACARIIITMASFRFVLATTKKRCALWICVRVHVCVSDGCLEYNVKKGSIEILWSEFELEIISTVDEKSWRKGKRSVYKEAYSHPARWIYALILLSNVHSMFYRFVVLFWWNIRDSTRDLY